MKRKRLPAEMTEETFYLYGQLEMGQRRLAFFPGFGWLMLSRGYTKKPQPGVRFV